MWFRRSLLRPAPPLKLRRLQAYDRLAVQVTVTRHRTPRMPGTHVGGRLSRKERAGRDGR